MKFATYHYKNTDYRERGAIYKPKEVKQERSNNNLLQQREEEVVQVVDGETAQVKHLCLYCRNLQTTCR